MLRFADKSSPHMHLVAGSNELVASELIDKMASQFQRLTIWTVSVSLHAIGVMWELWWWNE